MKEIIKNHIKALIGISILLIICNLLNAVHPYVIKQILDIDFQSINVEKIILGLIIAYVTIHILFALFKNLRNIVVNKVMVIILKEIREKLFEKVLNFKMITFNKYNSSELYTRLTLDVDNLFNLFFGTLNTIGNNVLYIIFMVIMMFIANVNLAIIGTITILIIAIITYFSTRVLGNIDNKILKKRDKENKMFSELYNKNKITQLFKLQEKNVEKSNNLFNEELKLRKRYIFIHHFPYWVITIVQAIGIYLLLYYALNINLQISLGSIYLVLYYIKQCKSPLEEIFNQLEEMQTCINSYKKIKMILNENNDELLDNGKYIENLNGDIEFRNVSMKYDKEMILKNISFIIKKGTKVTIAGKTGVRKNNTCKCSYEVV